MMNDRLRPRGICRVTHIVRNKYGKRVSLSEALSVEAKESGILVPKQKIVKGNLVVNDGRAKLARLLGYKKSGLSSPTETAYIDAISLGDCKVSGSVDKQACLPTLSDSGLQSEIENLSGAPSGTFTFDHTEDEEISYPPQEARYPSSGWSPTLCDIQYSSGEYILTDSSVDFSTSGLGVQTTDQVSVNTPTSTPVLLGVKEVLSSTELVLHNPYGYTGLAVEYSISTPGTQVLFSKLIEGNSFLQADFGYAVMVHEAGLFFNDGTLFNRVVFRPDSDSVGLVLQSDEANGNEISLRFEWLVTF